MRRALVIAAITALAVARPETYKEKEDFQYSRSSSDDGTKSGFYGAQRGNMGGNYERAHNMDGLAQHQMGGLVKTVEGELGDGAKQKSGSVFSAANSRGVYGSGQYDLSNLGGRNFQESTSVGDSHSHSSLSSQSAAGYGTQYSASNSGYGTHSQNSRYSGYHANDNSDQTLYANNMQSVDNLQSASQYDANQAAHNSGYYSQSGYNRQNAYDQTAANSHSSTDYGANSAQGANIRLMSTTPVRVVVRPGGRVAIPIAAQTYDTSHNSASTFDQNAIHSETEVLGSNNNQQTLYKPNNGAKHYENSYNYRKEWERHDDHPVTTLPIALPTVNPYPSNSELYEDTQAHGSEYQQQVNAQADQNVHSGRTYSGYNVKSGSSQSKYQAAGYNQHSAVSDTSAASNTLASSINTHGGYNHGVSANLNAGNLNNQVEDFSTKPKSYQSSYSYHKSWERQGDPYIIKPASNGIYTIADTQGSQRLTSLNQGANGYGALQYGTQYTQGQQRYPINGGESDCDEHGHIRVARSYNLHNNQNPNQQSENIYEGQDLSQQSQNLEDFSQQSQNLHPGQETQQLEDFGQQTQNQESYGQQSQHLEDFSQQSQNLHDFGQQSQNLDDFSQQAQNLEGFGQQSQKLEDFGQQTQDVGQETQSQWDNLEQSQQTQNQFDDKFLGEQEIQSQWDLQSQTDLGQQTQNTWSTLETIQNGSGGGDTEQQHEVMDHTSDSHQGTNAFQSQENTFEINPSNTNTWHKPESQTPPVDNMEHPLVYVTFNHNHETVQDKVDTEKDQTNLDDIAQQTHSYWHQTNMNQNEPSLIVPLSFDSDRVGLEHQIWQQYLNEHNLHLNSGYVNQQNYFSHNTGHSHPNNQYVNTNYGYISPYQHPGSGSSVNSYVNTQTHYSSNDHSSHSTSNIDLSANEPGSTSLTNLWSLLDNIEKETTSTDSFSSNHAQQDKQNNTELTQNEYKHTFNTESDSKYLNVYLHSTTEAPKNETTTIKQYKVDSLEVERGDIGPEDKLRPQEDIGRGDIGPDDSSSVNTYILNKPLQIFETKPIDSKPYKTPQEIETLSLTKETNKTLANEHNRIDKDNRDDTQNDDKQDESLLSVVGLENQKQFEHNEQNNWKLQSDIQISTSTTQKYNYFAHTNLNTGFENIRRQNEDKIENSEQSQVNYNQFGSFDNQNVLVDQQNENQPMKPGQQNETLVQEHLFGNDDQENVNLNQQNIDHHGFNIEHGPDDVHRNMDQQFETLGQQSESMDQQSLNQFEDQQSENLGQQLQPFDTVGQESGSLVINQENINDFGQHEQFEQESLPEFDHQTGHPNEQQLENWGEHNEQLEQQTQIEDLNQHTQTLGKPSEDIHQEIAQVEVFVPPLNDDKEGRDLHYSEPVVEPEIVTKKDTNVDEPPEQVPEKVGFWNKVGSKFSSAKDKVASWFSRS